MTITLKMVVTVLFSMMLIGCGQSREEIGETVKKSMQEEFDSNSSFKHWHFKVTEVEVLKKDNNQYQGLAKITYKGTSHNVVVEITVDGDKTMWQVSPEEFRFVFRY